MDELDGIMTAKRSGKQQGYVYCFVTAFVNYTIEGYKVDAVRYILKDNKNLVASVYECMDAIHEKWIIRLLGLNLISAKVQGKFH